MGEDGDPLDAPVLLEEPTFPGCVIRLPRAGACSAATKGDDKVLCVPVDQRASWLEIDGRVGVPPPGNPALFEVYKDLEPGKSVEGREEC